MKTPTRIDLFIGTVQINRVNQDQSDWIETLTINDHHVDFKLDTGAQANIIPKQVFDKLKLNDQQLTKTRVKLVTYGGIGIISRLWNVLCAAKCMTC